MIKANKKLFYNHIIKNKFSRSNYKITNLKTAKHLKKKHLIIRRTNPQSYPKIYKSSPAEILRQMRNKKASWETR